MTLSIANQSALMLAKPAVEQFGHIGMLASHVRAHALTEGADSVVARMFDRSMAWGQGWGTHGPLLASVVAVARAGCVVELGGGHFSTPLLAEMCGAMGRKLFSFEHDPQWVGYNADVCPVRIVSDWPAFRAAYTRKTFKPAVIFIDNEPGSERAANVRWAKSMGAEFVVCHDTLHPEKEDLEWYAGMNTELGRFKFRHDYTRMASCTSVVSDVRAYPGAGKVR